MIKATSSSVAETMSYVNSITGLRDSILSFVNNKNNNKINIKYSKYCNIHGTRVLIKKEFSHYIDDSIH